MEQNTDFQAARSVAIDCLRNANGLIREARKQSQADGNAESPYNCWTLPLKIQEYCDFLDSSRDSRTKLHALNNRLMQVRSDFEPYQHGTLSEATAHALAEKFAHRLWMGIHGVIYADSVLRLGRKPDEDSSFQLDSALVWHNRVEIRDRIRAVEPMDAERYCNIIQVECQKAIHAFAPDKKEPKQPDEFQYGPLEGSQKDIARWVLPLSGSQDPRGLKNLVDNGLIRLEKTGTRNSTWVWFHLETKYAEANQRRLSEQEKAQL